MSLRLSASDIELRNRFYALHTPSDVASLLEVSYAELEYYFYKLSPERKYTLIGIPKKSGGQRQIAIPHPSIKIIQQKLNQVLKCVYRPSPPAHGFVVKKSIVSNARPHLKSKWILNVDLKDFFPSINFGRVRGLFMAPPYALPPKVATVLAQICCFNDGTNSVLPQGAPTSPIISNMICYRMDGALKRLAQQYKCFYTRYADDLTFSTHYIDFPVELAVLNLEDPDSPVRLGEALGHVISANGFKVNDKKVRLHNERCCQEVTGVIVNEKLNVPRRYIRKVRAMIFSWERYGLDTASWLFTAHAAGEQKYVGPYKEPASFASVVRGRIEFVGMVRGKDDTTYRGLLNRYKRLTDPYYVEDVRQQISGGKDTRITQPSSISSLGPLPQVFVSYSHQDEDLMWQVHDTLTAEGFDLWTDAHLEPGTPSWKQEIEEALERAGAMVVILSPDAKKSKWVKEEINYADTQNKPIFCVFARGNESNAIPFGLTAAQRIDVRPEANYQVEVHRLVVALRKRLSS